MSMNTFKVTFANGNSLVTGFNGDLAEACQYYRLGREFNLGKGGNDDVQAVAKVEQQFETPMASLSCFVQVTKAGVVTDLGPFKMIENQKGAEVGGKMLKGFFFDYRGLVEELINRQILADEDDANTLCDIIEYKLNGGIEYCGMPVPTWSGLYELEEEAVVLSYEIEPDAIKTNEGFVFVRQSDGSYSDSHVSWPTLKDLEEIGGISWKPCPKPND